MQNTCADSENQESYTCTDEKRELIGTWCTPEIQTAVCLGYKVLKIYEVYHWNETTKYDSCIEEWGLFAQYINTFLKFKQKATGSPDWIKTIEDAEKDIQEYFKKEGVVLDRYSIQKNPGLRALAKLCLNSFWGQRLNMRQTHYFHEAEEKQFFQVFCNPWNNRKTFTSSPTSWCK